MPRCCASRAAPKPTSSANSGATSRARSCATPSRSPASPRRATSSAAWRLEGETREMAYAVVPAAAFASASSRSRRPTWPAYYEQHKSEFMTPETVALQYMKLDLAAIAAEIQVTEEALRGILRRDRSRALHDAGTASRQPHPDRSRHRRCGRPEEGRADRGATARPVRISRSWRVRIRTTRARNRPGVTSVGPTREAYVPAFADALFGMKQGEVSAPVKTQFGYHVIRLDGIEAPGQRSFEEVRAELEPEYRREQAQNVFYEKSQQLADESFAALTELDTVEEAGPATCRRSRASRARAAGRSTTTARSSTRCSAKPCSRAPEQRADRAR